MQVLATQGMFSRHCHRALLIAARPLVDDVIGENDMGHGIDGGLHTSDDNAAVPCAGGRQIV